MPNQSGSADYLVLNVKIVDLITKRGVYLIQIREGGGPRPPLSCSCRLRLQTNLMPMAWLRRAGRGQEGLARLAASACHPS